MTLCHKCYLPFPHNPNSQQQSVVETETMVTTTPPTISTNKNALALAVPGPASSATLFIRFYDFWKILLYFLINCVILFDVWFCGIGLDVCLSVSLSACLSICHFSETLVDVDIVLGLLLLFDDSSSFPTCSSCLTILSFTLLFSAWQITRALKERKVCTLCVWLSL